MDIFPELYTSRLKLRRILADDIPSLMKYANNRKISDYVLNIPHPYQEPDAVFRISYVLQGFKAKTRYVFAVIIRETDEFIGEIGLHLDNNKGLAQLGYWIGEPFWGQGFVTEAVAAMLKFGFEKLNLEQVFATVHRENVGSGKVLEKNGMNEVGATGSIAQYSLTKNLFTRPV